MPEPADRPWTRTRHTPNQTPRSRSAVRVLLVGLTLVYLITFYRHSPGFSTFHDGVLGHLVTGGAALVCFGRAAFFSVRRWPFLLLGTGAAAYTAGDLLIVLMYSDVDAAPVPNPADIAYLSIYPLQIAALLLLARPETKGISRGSLLDGVIGGLGCAAAGSILIVEPALSPLSGSLLAQVVGGAYPVFGLLVLAVVVAAITLRGGRPSPTWFFLSAGILAQVLADSIYLHRLAVGSWVAGTPLDGIWAVGFALTAIAATCSDRPSVRGPEVTARILVLPNVFSVIAVATLVYGSLSVNRLPVYAVVLTCAALITAVKRTAIGFSALRLLASSQRQARTDELTQLANRRHFDQRVRQALVHRPPDERIALVMVDLDDFKAVNDTFGHQAGDELLRQIASRLRRVLRPGDLLARLGGDEFVFLLADCDCERALRIGGRMLAEISLPMTIGGAVHLPSASVGIAICPDDGDDLTVLMRQADIAMFDAKAGQQGATLYDPARHQDIGSGLNAREALDRHELTVVYQPQFDLVDGRMTGVEALVRWAHPTRGLLAPDTFLSLFERAGLMGELTLEVLAIAVRDRTGWQRAGTDLQLSVNVAPSALLSDDLTAPMLAVLAQYRMPAEVLTLEITENAVIMDVERSRQTLDDLQALGIQLSLDDYGTGYCSLTYLRDLSLDEVKIDRSFVTDLAPGSTDEMIVASTVWLAKKLGLRTVAEGVETPAALALLRDLGCASAQGYLLARPVPADQVLLQARPAALIAAPALTPG